MFGWLPADLIKQTLEVTTQYACLPMSTLLKKQYKSPFPALNAHWRDELVATNTINSDTPAVDSRATIAQVFIGVDSLVTDVYAIKTNQQFINTLEDQIQTWGAPTKLVIGLRWKKATKSRKFSMLTALLTGKVSLTTSTRTLLSTGSSSWRLWLTPSWTMLVHHPMLGFSASNMSPSCWTWCTCPSLRAPPLCSNWFH